MKRVAVLVALLAVVGLASAGCSSPGTATSTAHAAANGENIKCPPSDVPGGPTGCYLVPPGIHKIKHVIIIMQENRSFDSYFGTYPGAEGSPRSKAFHVCVPDPATKTCVAPFHDVYDVNRGRPARLN